MKALIINLPRHSARRRLMEQSIKDTPFDSYEFVDGVDARAMTEGQRRMAFDYAGFAAIHQIPPGIGEVGCALAHRKAWKRVAELGTPAAVLEDDLRFENDWNGITEFADNWLDTDEPRALLLPRHFFYRRTEPAGKRHMAEPYNCYGGEFYMLNPAGAQLLLGLGRPRFVADDWDFYRKNGLTVRAMFPHPVIVDDGGVSSIGGHIHERMDWDGAARSANPGVMLFDFYHMLGLVIGFRTGFLKRYLSISEL